MSYLPLKCDSERVNTWRDLVSRASVQGNSLQRVLNQVPKIYLFISLFFFLLSQYPVVFNAGKALRGFINGWIAFLERLIATETQEEGKETGKKNKAAETFEKRKHFTS